MMPNTRKRMAYFSYESDKHYFFLFSDNKCKDEVQFVSQRKKVDEVIYPFNIFIKSNKCKKTATDFVEICKNYASYIHTFSLTDNFQNSRKKGKKREKKLTLNEYSINYSTVF